MTWTRRGDNERIFIAKVICNFCKCQFDFFHHQKTYNLIILFLIASDFNREREGRENKWGNDFGVQTDLNEENCLDKFERSFSMKV